MKKCRYIFARGEKTAEFLKDLDYPAEKTDQVADVAFLYQPEFSLSEENEERVTALLKKDQRDPQTGSGVFPQYFGKYTISEERLGLRRKIL